MYVVTLTQVYDFQDPQHVHAFRFAVEADSYYPIGVKFGQGPRQSASGRRYSNGWSVEG